MGVVLFIHIVACILLIILVLIQSGRGGGLVSGFSGVESMFGPKTNTFLTRATAVFSTLFFITCLTLAFLSVRQGRSLMKSVKPQAQAAAAPVAPSNTTVATPPAPAQPQATAAQTAVATETKPAPAPATPATQSAPASQK